MRLEAADHDLSAVVSDLIAADMAATLIDHGADLTNDRAVAFCLHDAGFGSASIAALMDDARSIAAALMPSAAPFLAEVFA